VKGIPQVMFEGLMTNIDRRIQLFSFVRNQEYKVRALGSLEAENLFAAIHCRCSPDEKHILRAPLEGNYDFLG
jgi:hypothetical protein